MSNDPLRAPTPEQLLDKLKALMARSEQDRKFGPAACRIACLAAITGYVADVESRLSDAKEQAKAEREWRLAADDAAAYLKARAEAAEQHLATARADKEQKGKPMTDGTDQIALERQRQQQVEGWTEAHDDAHTKCELLDAARCYINHAIAPEAFPAPFWPWEMSWWKPGDPIRDLVKAGALIAAEIDRLQRTTARADLSRLRTRQEEQAYKALAERAVAVLQRHAPPDGLSDHDAMSEFYGIFDGSEYRAALSQATARTPTTETQK